MNRSFLLVAFIFVVTLVIGSVSVLHAGAGVDLPQQDCGRGDCVFIQPGVFTDPSWLRVAHHRVDVEIENQIATTNVDLKFVNEGDGLAEGTFVFPLPLEAAVDELIMYIDGFPIEARILPAEEARAIYDEIVRQYRDPALLEYIGMQAVQANIFPIPPGEERRIEIRYGQVLEADNGLIKFTYPMDVTSLTSSRRVDLASISITVESNDPISNVYSPSHEIGVVRRDDDRGFDVGWEATRYAPDEDFVLYYGIANETINVNLLTFRESADEDGFFMLLVQPPVSLPEDQIIPRDVIIVLDQSGSMGDQDKWAQAQEAAAYVLDNLNPRDRFNVVLFSTGWRLFSRELEGVEVADEARRWIDSQFANGGTDINGALTAALDLADRERPTTILFLTDGLATEGVVETDAILANIEDKAPSNVRIFTFGVGDDVDTFLLDALVQNHRGTGTYVRPFERIEEEVASLYNKIGTPVLTDVELDFGDAWVELMYPTAPLPDLFAGTQLTIVGRYRGEADDVTITLSGQIDGATRSFAYDGLDFRGRAGGEGFVARLWATRRIGDLLNTIRLEGETDELVDSIIDLSVRYGIITPYTSFLIEENDILTQSGREVAGEQFRDEARALNQAQSGAAAVDAADSFAEFEAAEAPMVAAQPTQTAAAQSQAAPPAQQPADVGGGAGGALPDDAQAELDMDGAADDGIPTNPVQIVRGKTFLLQDGVWTDTTFAPDTMDTVEIIFLSDDYFDLLDEFPEAGEYLALGERVIVVLDGVAYEIVPE